MPGVAFLVGSGRKLTPPGGAYGPYAVVVIRLGESCELHIVATGNGFIYALLLRACDGIK